MRPNLHREHFFSVRTSCGAIKTSSVPGSDKGHHNCTWKVDLIRNRWAVTDLHDGHYYGSDWATVLAKEWNHKSGMMDGCMGSANKTIMFFNGVVIWFAGTLDQIFTPGGRKRKRNEESIDTAIKPSKFFICTISLQSTFSGGDFSVRQWNTVCCCVTQLFSRFSCIVVAVQQQFGLLLRCNNNPNDLRVCRRCAIELLVI